MSHSIKTAADLDYLPVGSVVTSRSGRAYQKTAMPRKPWRTYDLPPLSSDALLRGHPHGVTLVYDPTAQANVDARPEAVEVAGEMLRAELPASAGSDGIAQRLIAALAGDGLIHYSPAPWDFTPGCSLMLHGPGPMSAADLDAVPPRSVVVTEEEGIWQKETDGSWQWQGGQVFGEPMVSDLDPRKEPKSGADLAQKGPMALITTGWEA